MSRSAVLGEGFGEVVHFLRQNKNYFIIKIEWRKLINFKFMEWIYNFNAIKKPSELQKINSFCLKMLFVLWGAKKMYFLRESRFFQKIKIFVWKSFPKRSFFFSFIKRQSWTSFIIFVIPIHSSIQPFIKLKNERRLRNDSRGEQIKTRLFFWRQIEKVLPGLRNSLASP